MAIEETIVYVINYINTIPGRDWGSALPINDRTRLNGWIMDHGSRWIVDIQSSETFRTLSLWFGTCPEEGTGSFTTFRPCRIIALVVLTISLRYTRYNIIGRRGNWSFHRRERERQNCHAISRTSTLYECWKLSFERNLPSNLDNLR